MVKRSAGSMREVETLSIINQSIKRWSLDPKPLTRTSDQRTPPEVFSDTLFV
jgi:hypothetical protein